MPERDPVAEALAALGLTPQFRTYPEGTATAEQAAAAVGCEVGQIVKSLIFVAGDELLLLLVSGANRVDEAKVAELARAPVRKATAKEVEARTGFRIGLVPPVGHSAPLRVFLDRDLMDHPVVWSASGVHNRVFPMAPVMLSAAAGATIAALKVAS
jgi:prolyl-tRNA editing enzyme YbaK/EbsC (Cys-tRNA(Pro) deacylase)